MTRQASVRCGTCRPVVGTGRSGAPHTIWFPSKFSMKGHPFLGAVLIPKPLCELEIHRCPHLSRRFLLAPLPNLVLTSSVLGCGDGAVPIRPLLESDPGAFGPDDVEALVSAFEASLKALRLVDRRDPAVLIVARRVIALAKEGTRDPIVLRDQVLKSFKSGVANGS